MYGLSLWNVVSPDAQYIYIYIYIYVVSVSGVSGHLACNSMSATNLSYMSTNSGMGNQNIASGSEGMLGVNAMQPTRTGMMVSSGASHPGALVGAAGAGALTSLQSSNVMLPYQSTDPSQG